MGPKFEMLFMNGKRKALTLSYDDGTVHDRKLVELMNRYGLRGTFNLNSGTFSLKETIEKEGVKTDFSRIDADEVKELYQGHEVASHTLTHPSLTELPSNLAAAEVIRDRELLEGLTGEIVRGFAYPYGTYNKEVEKVLKVCGIEYARTVVSTNDFVIPQNFLEWHPTCHHDSPKLMELIRDFCEKEGNSVRLFYLWGHSYEFAQNDNWQVIEEFFKYVSGYMDKIWIATNLEIMDYVKAFSNLKWSMDGKTVYNPSGIKLWLKMDGQIYCIDGNSKLSF
ncbi:MAG: polysaccharide deacetylase family protein [Bacillota bacterium]|nr:polysaccharide deacetylase family protein [Bacillota bacterium]